MYSNQEAEERHSGEVAKSLRMTNRWVTYTERRSVISITDQKVNGTQLWVIRSNLKWEQGKQERKHTITRGVSAELFTKRRQSVNCQSGDGYVGSEVSDHDWTWVYNRLEALWSHELSCGHDMRHEWVIGEAQGRGGWSAMGVVVCTQSRWAQEIPSTECPHTHMHSSVTGSRTTAKVLVMWIGQRTSGLVAVTCWVIG